MEALKLSDYFELRRPTYRYIKITPHKSIRNYTTQALSKSISATYRSINKRIYKEKKKLIIETEFSIKYVIDIEEGNANFYFIVPTFFLDICLEKIMSIWNKATVEVLERGIKPFSKNMQVYGLNYKYMDGLSLNVDRKMNEPLNSILRVMEIMKDDDRITVVYNFMPRTSIGFSEVYEDTINRFKEKRNIQKPNWSFDYIVLKILDITISLIEGGISVLNDFLGSSENDVKIKRDYYLEGLLEKKFDDLSSETKKKKDMNVIDTQIAVVSDGRDYIRRNNNINAVAQAFRSIDGDNELIKKEYKHKFNLEDYSLNTKTSILSTDEISQLVQIPGRSTLMQLGIKHVKTEESKVPLELQSGFKRLGVSKYKGELTNAYLEDEYNTGNLPLVLIGSQGGGKTTYMGNYAKDCTKECEGLIIIDFIKNCELSEDIKMYVDVDKLIEIDLGSKDTIQGLGFNEVKITDDMNEFDKLKYANLQSQQIMDLIDSISVGDPLSSRMRRFLNAAANVVFSLGYNSVRNVVECLENYKKRLFYIEQLKEFPDLKDNLEDEINTLNELNEFSKVTSKEQKEGIEPKIIGTKESKIEHILDRVSTLREDFKLKYMYNKTLENNINLVECMNKGETVLFKMRESDFPTKMAKNLLVTYIVSKVWLASQLRGMIDKKPLRCNVLIDEVFQAPTCMKKLEYILPQSRKFGCKFVFSTQYIRQLEGIFDTLEASGSSYMLLKGCLEDDFNHFRSKLEGFEYEDLRDMEQFSSLNLIYYSGGYSSFITKLPKPI
ncbi:hypothetical protein I3900191A7_16570 [Clostridium baratii]|uniref:hypothetical protein n=1 Tax=Clostridium baratii TaxID=1561 RepID=UPI0036F354D0